MSDAGSSWWLGADRLWRKGRPPSGWHQTRDGLWHPPSTAATRLKVETTGSTEPTAVPEPPDEPGGAGPLPRPETGRHERAEYERHEPLEPLPPVEPLRPLDGGTPLDDRADHDAGARSAPAADGSDDDDPDGYDDGYETAYYDSTYPDDDLDDDAAHARHMAGHGPDRWSVADRVRELPPWVRLAVPSAAAVVVLLAGLGFALSDMGGGQAGDGSQVESGGSSSSEYAGGDAVGGSPTSTSGATVTTGGTSGPTTSSVAARLSPPTTAASGPGAGGAPPPPGGGESRPPGDATPPPRTDPTTTEPSVPSSPNPPPPSEPPSDDPMRHCEGLERLLPTDPDFDGIYCE
jgi:hypothetical protein